jgi:hypothetical protein
MMTKRTTCNILLVLLFSALLATDVQRSAGKTLDPELTKNEVLKLEDQLDQAFLTADTRVLTGLWADDFVYVGTNAEILTKAQRLAQLQSKTVMYGALTRDDVRVVTYEDTVVVTGRCTSTILMRDNGSWGPLGISHLESPGRISGIALFTHVYVRLHGRWQIILEHLTYITED